MEFSFPTFFIQTIIQIEKKKEFFCQAANQSAETRVEGKKCRCYKTIYAQIKQTQTRTMMMIVRWRKLNRIHKVNYLLAVKSKFDDVLQSFSL